MKRFICCGISSIYYSLLFPQMLIIAVKGTRALLYGTHGQINCKIVVQHKHYSGLIWEWHPKLNPLTYHAIIDIIN
jgi:hypothetical protein